MKEYSVGFIPGPVSVPKNYASAWQTDFGSSHLEPEFYELYAQNQAQLQKLLGTKNRVVITLGEVTSALWGSIKSLLKPGEKLLAAASGYYGDGFANMAKTLGVETEVVSAEYDSLTDPQKVREAALRFRPRMISAVHCETPSGILRPLKDLKALGEIAREVDALFVVDVVSSGGGTPVDADENLIDVTLLGSQKVLALPPSLSISTFSARAWDAAKKVNYAGYDACLPWIDVPENRAVPYTHDWHSMAALGLSLSSLMEEGVENVFARHSRAAALCRKTAREIGLRIFPADEATCSPTISSFCVPEGWTWEAFDAALRERGMAVGGNYGRLAGKVFRIGHMGSQADETRVARGMEIIREVLKK